VQIKTRLSLKPDKDRPIRQRHHWIFSGAVQEMPAFEDGSPAEVFSASGEKLGIALLNKGKSIVGQMIAFGSESLEEALKSRIAGAAALRRRLFDPSFTNAFRLINTEGDGLPGLIVDSYNDILVLQISTPGMENLKEQILSLLIAECNPKAVFEKSTSALRKREGLSDQKGHLYGEPNPKVTILENGLFFAVHLLEGQKTGLFLDQREMRAQIGQISSQKKVLNCFSYTGGFSIAALAANALHVDSIDISAKCGPVIDENLELNQISLDKHRFIAGDAIDFVIQQPLDYDVVILDPPAFAKKRQDVPKATHAYRKLNRKTIEKMAPGSLLLTCSCSSQIEEVLFQKILFQASLEANRQVRILGRHRQAADHPISIYHPESSYLKSLLLEVL
jgi:23S rRNA (cytosine1962-C5)-methyltransferase